MKKNIPYNDGVCHGLFSYTYKGMDVRVVELRPNLDFGQKSLWQVDFSLLQMKNA